MPLPENSVQEIDTVAIKNKSSVRYTQPAEEDVLPPKRAGTKKVGKVEEDESEPEQVPVKKGKAKSAPVADEPAVGKRGRQIDPAVWQIKVIAASDPVAREGSFYGIAQSIAKKPIKLGDLLDRMDAELPDLKSAHDRSTVIRSRVLHGFRKSGHLIEA